jgi:DNA polymerase III alpha subunit
MPRTGHLVQRARFGAGSMVAYTLDITLVEPVHYGLIFERFLNPGRISMPDIDLDFQDDLRSKMMEYCAHKYGDDRVPRSSPLARWAPKPPSAMWAG